MGDTVIRVEGLSKRYRIGGKQGYTHYGSLRETLVQAAAASLRKIRSLATNNPIPHTTEILALKDVSFDIKQGVTLGIIGRNGAGKSTLLKILSRITKPSSGRAILRGRVGSLLEVGTGFHPELTGRENIYLNGAILGMTRREIERKFDEIVDFAEIEQFLETPVKFYSSGMYMRLAFAVAAHLEPEILLVDEVLAVGDVEFQKKCLGKMDEVAKEGRTVLFVSHNMGSVSNLCQHGILLDEGVLKFHGPISSCIDQYLSKQEFSNLIQVAFPDRSDLDIQIQDIRVSNSSGNSVNRYPMNQPIIVHINVLVKKRVSKHYLALHIHDSEQNTILFTRDFESNKEYLLEREPGLQSFFVEIPSHLLAPGIYRVSIHLAQSSPPQVIQRGDFVCPFEVVDTCSIRSEMGFPWHGKIGTILKWELESVRN